MMKVWFEGTESVLVSVTAMECFRGVACFSMIISLLSRAKGTSHIGLIQETVRIPEAKQGTIASGETIW